MQDIPGFPDSGKNSPSLKYLPTKIRIRQVLSELSLSTTERNYRKKKKENIPFLIKLEPCYNLSSYVTILTAFHVFQNVLLGNYFKQILLGNIVPLLGKCFD